MLQCVVVGDEVSSICILTRLWPKDCSISVGVRDYDCTVANLEIRCICKADDCADDGCCEITNCALGALCLRFEHAANSAFEPITHGRAVYLGKSFPTFKPCRTKFQ